MSTATRLRIPSLGALALSIGGCRDPIVGDWAATRIEGEDAPVTYSYQDGGYTYTYEYSAKLLVWPGLVGQLRFYYSYSYQSSDGKSSYGYGYAYRAEVEAQGGRTYAIDVGDSSLDCELTGGELSCDGDMEITFERDNG